MTAALTHIRTYHDELTALRQDFHAHPELGFDEHRTADVVAGLLASWGIEVHRGIGRTGVVGVLRGGNGSRAIGLRADMDALPIHETTGLPYASTNPGVMHACGHDGHTTMLLGAARYLAETRRFDGVVHFIFQPAEEGIGGALAMLEDGLLDRFPSDRLFGMHNAPGIEIGQFAIRPGAMMAGGALFDITVTGRGTHGARPEAGVDPVFAAAQIVTALQSIVARSIAPTDPAVVSCTAIHGGEAYNVIPETVRIRGTARAFRRDILTDIEARMRAIVTQVAASLGAVGELDFRLTFPPLVNDAACTTALADVAAALVGEDAVEREGKLILASEDFAFMTEIAPGAYINLGNGGGNPVHHPGYNFNDAAIPYGAAVYAGIVERELPAAKLA